MYDSDAENVKIQVPYRDAVHIKGWWNVFAKPQTF